MSLVVERLFLTVPRGCLQFVIVVFPDHTHFLFLHVMEFHRPSEWITDPSTVHMSLRHSVNSTGLNMKPLVLIFKVVMGKQNVRYRQLNACRRKPQVNT